MLSSVGPKFGLPHFLFFGRLTVVVMIWSKTANSEKRWVNIRDGAEERRGEERRAEQRRKSKERLIS
jgi:hypothetical protein